MNNYQSYDYFIIQEIKITVKEELIKMACVYEVIKN